MQRGMQDIMRLFQRSTAPGSLHNKYIVQSIFEFRLTTSQTEVMRVSDVNFRTFPTRWHPRRFARLKTLQATNMILRCDCDLRGTCRFTFHVALACLAGSPSLQT